MMFGIGETTLHVYIQYHLYLADLSQNARIVYHKNPPGIISHRQ